MQPPLEVPPRERYTLDLCSGSSEGAEVSARSMVDEEASCADVNEPPASSNESSGRLDGGGLDPAPASAIRAKLPGKRGGGGKIWSTFAFWKRLPPEDPAFLEASAPSRKDVAHADAAELQERLSEAASAGLPDTASAEHDRQAAFSEVKFISIKNRFIPTCRVVFKAGSGHQA